MSIIKRICILLAISILLAMLPGCRKFATNNNLSESTATTEQSQKRHAKDGIQTVLILCLDAYELPSDSIGYRNAKKADFMQLLIIDEQQKKITPIQLNPDTMISYDIPGTSKKEEMPIGMVFTYGSGGSDSCLNVINAVSSLLEGIKIDHYLTFTMDSVAVVNDMIGGVSVPDSTDSDDGNILLSGTDAVEFFSFRDDEDVANDSHMARQRQYIKAIYHPFIANTQSDDFLTKLALQLGERMTTNLTLSQLVSMFETLGSYNMEEEIITFPGDAQKIDNMYQFFIDEASVEAVLEKLIYE